MVWHWKLQCCPCQKKIVGWHSAKSDLNISISGSDKLTGKSAEFWLQLLTRIWKNLVFKYCDIAVKSQNYFYFKKSNLAYVYSNSKETKNCQSWGLKMKNKNIDKIKQISKIILHIFSQNSWISLFPFTLSKRLELVELFLGLD